MTAAPELEQLAVRVTAAIDPGFRGRLLERGLARGWIWREGVLPPEAPQFAPTLTEDLLDYAAGLMNQACRLRSLRGDQRLAQRAFFVAGQAIEAAIEH